MNFSDFKGSDWLVIWGGGGVAVFGLFNWTTVSVLGFSDSGGNAFDFFFTGTIPWLLFVASAIIVFLLASETMDKRGLPWPLILLAATALAALLLLFRFIFNPIEGKDIIEAAGGNVGRGFGMIVSVVSGLVAAAGAFLNFQASGGELSDLTDINKIKESFGGSSADTIPPPPPPADDTPPPPPAP
ncbi:MAG: hypothetical protein P8M10_07255 [Ilumatobacter sp.]|nr:hypothetical protein [Ilumatobacter sp.]